MPNKGSNTKQMNDNKAHSIITMLTAIMLTLILLIRDQLNWTKYKKNNQLQKENLVNSIDERNLKSVN